MFTKTYDEIFDGDERWNSLEIASGDRFAWDDETSTYIHRPPFFDGMPATPEPLQDITGARVLALLGDSGTTDQISPAGPARADPPAGPGHRAQGSEQTASNNR